MLGHARGVAALADEAARILGLPQAEVAVLNDLPEVGCRHFDAFSRLSTEIALDVLRERDRFVADLTIAS
jgi:hypothetical protein